MKKVLALILAVCLCVSVCVFPAFADEQEEKLKYVSFGDSCTNGFGYNGYYKMVNGSPNTYGRGLLVNIPQAYPTIIADDLNLDLTQLAISSLRCEDLYALLDYEGFSKSYLATMNDYNGQPGDDYYQWIMALDSEGGHRNYADGTQSGGEQLFQNFADNITETDAAKLGMPAGVFNSQNAREKLSWVYCNAVENADLITMCIGTNNLGSYLTYRLIGNENLGGLGQDVYQFDDKISPDMQKVINKDLLLKAQLDELELVLGIPDLITKITDALGVELLDEKIQMTLTNMKDALLYGYAGMCLNFKACYNAIRDMNKKAEIVLIGQSNLLAGMKIGANLAGIDISIDVGDIWQRVLDKYTAYMKAVSALDTNTVVIKYPAPETFFDQIKNSNGDFDKIEYDYACRLVDNMGAINDVGLSYSLDNVKLLAEAFQAMSAAEDEDAYDAAVAKYAGQLAAQISGDCTAKLKNAYNKLDTSYKLFAEASLIPYIDVMSLLSGGLSLDIDYINSIRDENPGAANALAYIYVKFMLGNGSVTVHPDSVGHEAVAAAIERSCACLGDHCYAAPVWSWTKTADGYKATATFTCLKNPIAHVEKIEADTEKTIVNPSILKSGDNVIYTAAVTVDGKTYKDTYSVFEPYTEGHSLVYNILMKTMFDNHLVNSLRNFVLINPLRLITRIFG